jgi:hypothetical protein
VQAAVAGPGIIVGGVDDVRHVLTVDQTVPIVVGEVADDGHHVGMGEIVARAVGDGAVGGPLDDRIEGARLGLVQAGLVLGEFQRRGGREVLAVLKGPGVDRRRGVLGVFGNRWGLEAGLDRVFRARSEHQSGQDETTGGSICRSTWP